MTQEEKQLLLKDLCARLPFGIKTSTYIPHIEGGGENLERTLNSITIDKLNGPSLYPNEKPYLRTLSSMTEEESRTYRNYFRRMINNQAFVNLNKVEEYIDYLNSHHFDYRNLIDKGLALEAPEGMYK